MVIEVKVGAEPLKGISGCVVLMQIDFFIFERAPQALGKDVVEGAALAAHATLDSSGQRPVGVGRVGIPRPAS